jgi:hypothetical protein
MDCFVAIAPRNDGLVGDRTSQASAGLERINRIGCRGWAERVQTALILMKRAPFRPLIRMSSAPDGQIIRCCVHPLSHLCITSDFQKLFLTLDPNQMFIPRHPALSKRGVSRSSRTLARGAMDADALLTNGA